MSYYNFPKRKADTSDLSKLIRKVDDALSEVVRLTAADDKGYCKCITCGDKQHWTDMTCGHFVKRRHMATRFELKNTGAQCSTCNCVNDGKEEEHALYIDRTYGYGAADKLRKAATRERKWSAAELDGLYKELKAEIKRLRSEKLKLD